MISSGSLPFASLAVNVALLRDSEVLMIRRCATGWRDGQYALVAGHIHPSETPDAAAVREVEEETSLRLVNADLVPLLTVVRIEPDGTWVDLVYTCDRFSGTPSIREPDKADDLIWVPLASVPANTIPHARVAIRQILRGGPAFASMVFNGMPSLTDGVGDSRGN